MSEYKKYCESLDCIICDEKEPCIYKIANKLQQQLQDKEQECEHLKRYENLFIKAREIYLRTSKTNKQIVSENEDLKDTIKRFTCQAECYKHKEAEKLEQVLDEIEEFCKQNHYCLESENRWFSDEIQDIINKAKDGE